MNQRIFSLLTNNQTINYNCIIMNYKFRKIKYISYNNKFRQAKIQTAFKIFMNLRVTYNK